MVELIWASCDGDEMLLAKGESTES